MIDRLRHRLATLPLPGRDAMLTMAPAGRGFMPIEEARANGCREASTLVLLYPVAGEVKVVLTLRTAHLKDHSGQVSFPGGRLELGEDAVDCALREAWEELGIPADAVEVLGHLTPLHIGPSNFCLWPVLAVSQERPAFAIHDAEVAELIECPVARLLDPAFLGSEERVLQSGQRREVPFYNCQGHKVWGATAMILAELAAVWREVGGTRDDGALGGTN